MEEQGGTGHDWEVMDGERLEAEVFHDHRGQWRISGHLLLPENV